MPLFRAYYFVRFKERVTRSVQASLRRWTRRREIAALTRSCAHMCTRHARGPLMESAYHGCTAKVALAERLLRVRSWVRAIWCKAVWVQLHFLIRARIAAGSVRELTARESNCDVRLCSHFFFSLSSHSSRTFITMNTREENLSPRFVTGNIVTFIFRFCIRCLLLVQENVPFSRGGRNWLVGVIGERAR